MDLLLLADEEERMLNRYLNQGEMYALEDGGVKAVCIVTDEGGGLLELKNLAVRPGFQRQGYGRRMIAFLKEKYRGRYRALQVGTGDSPLTMPFYIACGFVYSHRIAGFFTENYSRPIWEGGRRLTDMVYLRMALDRPGEGR